MLPSSPPNWIDAHQRLVNDLSHEEMLKFCQVNTQDRLEKLFSRLQKARDALRAQRIPTRLEKVVSLLKPVAAAADVIAQGSGIPSGSLWGAFGLVVELASSKADFVEVILKNYELLLTTLPRLQSYTSVLSESPALQVAVGDFFDAYITLSQRCLKAFCRGNPNPLTRVKWRRDQRAFEFTLSKLKKLSEKVQVEASYAIEHQSRQLDEKRHQQLMDKQQEVVSAVSMISDSPQYEPRVSRFNVPYARNSSFHGRLDQLDSISKHLLPGKSEVEQTQKAVVLCGLGGVGKTQIALEFTHRYRRSYQACFWVTCDSTVKAAQGYTEIAKILGFGDMGDVQNQMNVKDWFCSTDDDWLLVYDNAENAASLADLWPPSSRGSILITSQDSSWLYQEHISFHILLESFDQQDSKAMLRSILSKQGQELSEEVATALVVETGGLPLAIRHIASYIRATESDPMEFLQTYHEDRSSSSTVDEWDENIPPWYRHTLATFLNFAFRQLNDQSIFLLIIVSFLDPDCIQEEFFTHSLGPSELQPFRNKASYDLAVNKLRRYSLITRHKVDGSSHFSVHRQVKRHVHNHLKAAQLQNAFDWALKRLRQLFPRQSPYAEPLSNRIKGCSEWISHIIAINRAASLLKETLQLPQLLAQLFQDGATYLWARGLLEEGKGLTLAAKEICESHKDCDQLLIGEVYSFHACILSDSGDIDQAATYFERSAQNRREHLFRLKQNHQTADMLDEILLANAYNNLAGIYCAQGRYSDAELYNELSLGIKKRWEKQSNLSYLLTLSYQNIAMVYARRGKFDDAAIYFEKAIALSDPDESMVRRALTFHNYGSMRYAQGLVALAQELMEQAFQLRWESLGDHYDTATSLHMLAACYHAQKSEDSLIVARDLLNEALRILKSRPSSIDKRRIARSLYKLSVVLSDLKDPSAEQVRKEAHQWRSEVTGCPSHEDSEEVFDDLVAYV